MRKRSTILSRIIDEVNQLASDAEIYLYGSRARGTANKLSDWDLLILLNSSAVSINLETAIMDKLYEIELETGAVISPLIYTKSDWNTNYPATPLFLNIQREGERVK